MPQPAAEPLVRDESSLSGAPPHLYKASQLKRPLPDSDLPPPVAAQIQKATTRSSPSELSASARQIRDILENNHAADLIEELTTCPPAGHYQDHHRRHHGGGLYHDHHRHHQRTDGNPDQPQQSAIVELQSDLSPIEAARLLWESNILGAPVWSDKHLRYVGFFDMRAILRVLTASPWEGDGVSSSPRFRSILVSSLQELQEEHPTIELIASLNRFYSCTPRTSLADLCRILSMMRCHRMPVIDVQKGRVSYIISQGKLVDFLFTKLGLDLDLDLDLEHDGDKCGDESDTAPIARAALSQTLEEAGLVYAKDVVSVRDTATASEAFGMLVSKGVSGLAVIDKDGRIVESTSAKDIKKAALDKERTDMHTSIIDYLSKVRASNESMDASVASSGSAQDANSSKEENDTNDNSSGCNGKQQPDRSTRRPLVPPIHAKQGATVGTILSTLALTGQHRVFITDNDMRPVGVVSVSDVLNFALGLTPPEHSVSSAGPGAPSSSVRRVHPND